MATNRRNITSEDLRNEVLEKIDHYVQDGFVEAKRLHEMIMAAAPDLCPRLWYGMPGYAKTKDSAVLCFFRKDALISFGVTEAVDVSTVNGENQSIIPSAWYILELDDEVEDKITGIVRAIT